MSTSCQHLSQKRKTLFTQSAILWEAAAEGLIRKYALTGCMVMIIMGGKMCEPGTWGNSQEAQDHVFKKGCVD